MNLIMLPDGTRLNVDALAHAEPWVQVTVKGAEVERVNQTYISLIGGFNKAVNCPFDVFCSLVDAAVARREASEEYAHSNSSGPTVSDMTAHFLAKTGEAASISPSFFHPPQMPMP